MSVTLENTRLLQLFHGFDTAKPAQLATANLMWEFGRCCAVAVILW